MLVLSRKPGEQVHIGQSITLTVLEVKGHSVRIGFEAPTQVPIVRGELCDPLAGALVSPRMGKSRRQHHAAGYS